MLKKFYVNSKVYYFDSETFIVSSSKNLPSSSKQSFFQKDVLQKVVINISNSCNLSCAYCYADGGNYGADSRLMDKMTADNIIGDILQRRIKRINRLILFGGEPFLNLELFTYFIEQLSSFLEIVKIETVTNGTILNSRVKKMITTYTPFLTVSLDGPEYIHDKLRGLGSHRRTLKVISYLKSIDYQNFEIASTYTRLHQKSNISRDDLYQYFAEMEVRFNINDVFSKNKILAVREAELSMDKRKDFIDQSIQSIVDNRNKDFISPILYDVLLSMIYKSKNDSFCDDINPDYTVTYDVDGSTKSCFRFWGTHNSEKVKFFNDKNNFQSCRDCWCKGMCMECVANFSDGYSSIISDEGRFIECQKQELMEYCVHKIISLSQESDSLSKLVNNFGRFIRYA